MTSSGDTAAGTGLLPEATRTWLAEHLGVPADAEVVALSGGNANDAVLVRWSDQRVFLRMPPADPVGPSAHNFVREHRVLTAVADAGIPTPRPLALCDDEDVPRAPFLAMEAIDGVAMTDTLPAAYGSVVGVGEELIDALARLHAVDWRGVGLDGFGLPDGFLARQVPRWTAQFEHNCTRDLPAFDRVAAELTRRLPDQADTTLIHGDYHLDNTLYAPDEPRLRAVIDWEMATIGDPLLDLGLVLAFWGERPIEPFALPQVQGVSRQTGAPPRETLAERYGAATGHDLAHLPVYMALAFFKLAAIIEGAYTLYRQGLLTTEYAAGLEHDVPRLLAEAEAHLSS